MQCLSGDSRSIFYTVVYIVGEQYIYTEVGIDVDADIDVNVDADVDVDVDVDVDTDIDVNVDVWQPHWRSILSA